MKRPPKPPPPNDEPATVDDIGTVLAAVLIGLSDGIISVFFSPTLAKILATLLVGLVLVFRPQGLFGARSE